MDKSEKLNDEAQHGEPLDGPGPLVGNEHVLSIRSRSIRAVDANDLFRAEDLRDENLGGVEVLRRWIKVVIVVRAEQANSFPATLQAFVQRSADWEARKGSFETPVDLSSGSAPEVRQTIKDPKSTTPPTRRRFVFHFGLQAADEYVFLLRYKPSVASPYEEFKTIDGGAPKSVSPGYVDFASEPTGPED